MSARYHHLDPHLWTRPIDVHLAGVGGTGSQVLTGLAQIHLALISFGHPAGLRVCAWDRDVVTTANIGRQLFSPADVGQSKAYVLVQRVNCYFGLKWRARAEEYTGEETQTCDVLICCVDSGATRRFIAENMREECPGETYPYWLDCGNEHDFGQVYLTKGGRQISHAPGATLGLPLPAIWDALPGTFVDQEPETDTPSCSLAEALGKQDLFINRHISTEALELLWHLLLDRKIRHYGAIVNLADGPVHRPVRIPVPGEKPAVARSSRRKAGTGG